MFLCICSDATHRAQRGKELRQEERSFSAEQNPFSVRRASRTPQACSKSHRPWRFVHLRARARARASSVFCFLPSLLHLSCNFFDFSRLRTKKRWRQGEGGEGWVCNWLWFN